MTASTVILLRQEFLIQDEAWVGGQKSKGLLKAWRGPRRQPRGQTPRWPRSLGLTHPPSFLTSDRACSSSTGTWLPETC